ncbi:hypothetical protein [Actinomycetospora soli]|uniref:hypothetical protein n=1 Tax=Actinomycetospora soli TaxID=2893887 RepID=UPI001E464BBD|nr:hypothetical protein [Actinomycetospora soli]MCD2191120.1 hypothetical protein [Actinomycetospora soli]
MLPERGLALVLGIYVAVSVTCALLGVAALVYRTLGHRCDISTLGPVVVLVAATTTATAGAAMIAVLRRSHT